MAAVGMPLVGMDSLECRPGSLASAACSFVAGVESGTVTWRTARHSVCLAGLLTEKELEWGGAVRKSGCSESEYVGWEAIGGWGGNSGCPVSDMAARTGGVSGAEGCLKQRVTDTCFGCERSEEHSDTAERKSW